MTTPVVPDFILTLFQNEINKIAGGILEKVCKLYKLDIDEVKKRLKDEMRIDVSISSNERIKVVKTQAVLPPEERCIARVFHRADLCLIQCSRRHCPNAQFCKRHQKMIDIAPLPYGTVKEPVPKTVVNRLKKIKVTKVHK